MCSPVVVDDDDDHDEAETTNMWPNYDGAGDTGRAFG